MLITEKDPAAMLAIIASEQDKLNCPGIGVVRGVCLSTDNPEFALTTLRELVDQGKVGLYNASGHCTAFIGDFHGENYSPITQGETP